MTPKLDTLTPEQKRTMIAEAVGVEPRKLWRVWWDKDRTCGVLMLLNKDECQRAIRLQREFLERIEDKEPFTPSEPEQYDDYDHAPRYTDSLDACHEMEKTLTQEECFIYRDLLQKAVLKEVAKRSMDFVFGATAEEKANAYLIAKGLAV